MVVVAIIVGALAASSTGASASSGDSTAIAPAPHTAPPVLKPAPVHAHAGVTEVHVDEIRPAFGRQSFGDVGRYEQVRGTIYGAVDPADPRNSPITDLSHAPRDADGFVDYAIQFVLLRPVDPARGNHKVVYEPTNRGHIVSLFFLNSAEPTNDPRLGPSAGNGFLMRQGYSIMEVGWDPTVANTDAGELQATYPIAKNADGSAITGPALEEITFDDTTSVDADGNSASMYFLTYPPATLDKSQATMTVRTTYNDTPTIVPSSDWGYNADGTGVHLLTGDGKFQQSKLYEFTYNATNPTVVGLSFAAVRDVADFMRNAGNDQVGGRNPVAGQAQQIYVFCYSQPCRFMHDFVRVGFNQAAKGGRAIDGIESLVGGASGGFFNYRFAQPGRTMRQHINRWYPERQFPFADQTTTDPVTGETGGILQKCTATNTCPKTFEINSETEYWNKAASLVDDRHVGQRSRPRAHAERAVLPLVESPPRAWVRHRRVRANTEPAAARPGHTRVAR